MTKTDIKLALETILNNATPSDSNQELDQAELTAITNALASDGLDTVNPNGPCYPPTPR